MRVAAQGATLKQHFDAGRLTMEMSWLLETDGSQRWTILDDREGHAGFDQEAEAMAEWLGRVERRAGPGDAR